MANEPSQQDLEQIGEYVHEYAYNLFKACDSEDDCFVQYVGLNSIVFGGRNRLVFSARSGFHPDRSYCDKHFLKMWDGLDINYQRNPTETEKQHVHDGNQGG